MIHIRPRQHNTKKLINLPIPLYVFVAFTALLSVSCRNHTNNSATLIGTWKVVSSDINDSSIRLSPGMSQIQLPKGLTFTFNSDSTVTISDQDMRPETGRYDVVQEDSNYFIVFRSDVPTKYKITKLRRDSLDLESANYFAITCHLIRQ